MRHFSEAISHYPFCAERSALQQFVAETFKQHHQAEVDSFCSHLLGVRNAAGVLCAAAGYNLAEQTPLFLEQYLDMPLEHTVSSLLGIQIHREELVEVGNLAAIEAGGARMLIQLLTLHLHQQGRRWVAFTATKQLLNSFNRMGLPTIKLADATPEKVKHPEKWGRYYEQHPVVVVGDIALGHAHIAAHPVSVRAQQNPSS